MSNSYDIIIDQSAIDRIGELRGNTPEFGDTTLLRAAVKGGGCSGFQYKIEPANEIESDDIIYNEVVVIDEMSAKYMQGSVIKFQNDLMSAMFIVDNPNANSSCGCSASFSLDPSKL